jgi:hypothetical protein
MPNDTLENKETITIFFLENIPPCLGTKIVLILFFYYLVKVHKFGLWEHR